MKSTKFISNMFRMPTKNQPYYVVVFPSHTRVTVSFVGLAYHGKDIYCV